MTKMVKDTWIYVFICLLFCLKNYSVDVESYDCTGAVLAVFPLLFSARQTFFSRFLFDFYKS